MYQSWVAAAALAAGTGVFAYAMTLERTPDMPSLRPMPDSVHVVPPPAATAVPEPKSNVVEVPPITVKAHPREARLEPKPEPVATRPCSTWREIGPAHVIRGQPSGAVSVRELCL